MSWNLKDFDHKIYIYIKMNFIPQSCFDSHPSHRTGGRVRVLWQSHIIYYHCFVSSCTYGRYFLSYFGYSSFLWYKLRLFRVNSAIFITFRVHQVQIKKVTLNRNKKRGVQRVEIGVLG